MKKGKFNIVIGAQAGSEGKGKMAAYLARKYQPEVVCTTASPNCGHTAYINGEKKTSYHLPISALEAEESFILLGPASIINLELLLREIKELQIPKRRIYIHPRAVMVRPYYLSRERELGLLRIGSTNQGVGVARMFKILRGEDITYAEDVEELQDRIGDTTTFINEFLNTGRTVLCETTQGFDLCLEHGISPRYCTSKMINPAAAMAEMGVSPKFIGDVYGVYRFFPVRVHNREGFSGDYAEAKEITWEEVAERCGAPHPLEEMTTATKLRRRVFEFSHSRFEKFITVCRPDYLCLQFANYITWKDYGVTKDSQLSLQTSWHINLIEGVYGVPVAYVGTSEEDMVDRGKDNEKGFAKENRKVSVAQIQPQRKAKGSVAEANYE